MPLLEFYAFPLWKTHKKKPGQLRNPVSIPATVKDFSGAQSDPCLMGTGGALSGSKTANA
jgi:hypothetical protein